MRKPGSKVCVCRWIHLYRRYAWVIAKALAMECGLPLVPGSDEATESVEDAVKFAEEFGMPIMLKAAMGGGGRGMRVVRTMVGLLCTCECS
jgi:biotin carboxylase